MRTENVAQSAHPVDRSRNLVFAARLLLLPVLLLALATTLTACEQALPAYELPLGREELEQAITAHKLDLKVGEQLSPDTSTHVFFELNETDGTRTYFFMSSQDAEGTRSAAVSIQPEAFEKSLVTSHERQRRLMKLLCRVYGLADDGGFIDQTEKYLSKRDPLIYQEVYSPMLQISDTVLSARYHPVEKNGSGEYVLSGLTISSREMMIESNKNFAHANAERFRYAADSTGAGSYIEALGVSDIPTEELASYPADALILLDAKLIGAEPATEQRIEALRLSESATAIYPPDYYVVTLEDGSGDRIEVLAKSPLIELDVFGQGRKRYYLSYHAADRLLNVDFAETIA